MKILITGINGFVGKYLHVTLVRSGHEVWGIDCASHSKNIFAVDICNKLALQEILDKISPKVVYHLAASAYAGSDKRNEIYTTNVDGTRTLLEVCVGLSVIPKFVFISSSQVYGSVPENMLPIDENMLLNPVNHYGASKAMGEMLVKAFHAEYDMDYVIFRPFNHTGPGQSTVFVIPKIVHAFKCSGSTVELGNVETARDFCDVRDVVRAYTMVLEHNVSSATYNIASGKAYSIKAIIYILKAMTGKNVNIDIKESFIRKNEIMKTVGSYYKIQSELGWEPTITLENTLQDMLNS